MSIAIATRLIVCSLVIGGCAPHRMPSDLQRDQSFESLATMRVGDESLSVYLCKRTAILINGNLSIAEAGVFDNALAVRFKSEAGKNVNGPAHAAAIDARGYFLTAAHCLENPSVYLIYSDGESPRIAIPRVVATFADRENHDFAIIHVDASPAVVFEWAESEQVAAGQTVVAVGARSPVALGSTLAGISESCMGGQITSTSLSDTDTIRLAHTVPLRPGDSGAPLATAGGKLLGINSRVQISWNGASTSIALRPDPQWIKQVIADDLQHTSPPTTRVPLTLKSPQTAHLVVKLWHGD